LQRGLVWPALLSGAGSVTPFALADFYFSTQFSAPAGDGTGFFVFALGAFFGLLGIFIIIFAIIQFLDTADHKALGALVLAGYGLLSIIVTALIILPLLYSPGLQDLPILFAGVVGLVLGWIGGIWGLVWDNPPVSSSIPPDESRLRRLFQKKWVLVFLLILLALETSILVLIAVEWSLGNQSFPTISLIAPVETMCTILTARVVSQSLVNRTVLYDCSGSPRKGPALKMSVFAGGAAVWSVPVFTLPTGYVKLWLVDGQGSCSSLGPISLTSGQAVGLGAYYQPPTYDYCAAISPSGPVSGFTIRWSLYKQ
jgi:hypothetical protein